MSDLAMSPEVIMSTAGAVLSLLFSYFPVLRTKYAALSPEAKSGIMIGLLLVIAAGLFGLGCAGLVNTGVGCDQNGAMRALTSLVLALATNQGTWSVTKNLRAPDVKRNQQRAQRMEELREQ
jgi:hypothetical protein